MARGENPRAPYKDPDVLGRARKCLARGDYLDTRHGAERKEERGITLIEVQEVIPSGWHEKRKDEYKVEHLSWNYAIRGKTIDQRALRIVIAFDPETGMLLITVIDLDVRNE